MGERPWGWCCAWCTARIWHSSTLLPPRPTLTVIKVAKINRDGFMPAGIIPPPGVACACRAAPKVGDEAAKAGGLEMEISQEGRKSLLSGA